MTPEEAFALLKVIAGLQLAVTHHATQEAILLREVEEMKSRLTALETTQKKEI